MAAAASQSGSPPELQTEEGGVAATVQDTSKKESSLDKAPTEAGETVVLKRHKAKKGTKKKEGKKAKKTAKKKKKIKPIRPKIWMLPNRKPFLNWIDHTFREYRLRGTTIAGEDGCANMATGGPTADFDLFLHQKFIRDYMQVHSPYRGILLYHGLGSGKTCSSISVAEGLSGEYQIVVLTPASLEANFMDELRKCGDPSFLLNQHWVFLRTERGSPQEKLALSQGLPLALIRKQRGAWLSRPGADPNFQDLEAPQQAQVSTQVNALIHKKYRIIHYNGLQNKHLNQWEAEEGNPFDNKVIIIDEVHNLISRVVGSGTTGKRLYNMLVQSTGSRFVLLSGTPMINDPIEVAYLLNLLRGSMTTYRCKITGKTGRWDESFYQVLRQIVPIDFIETDVRNQSIQITRNPFGFSSNLVAGNPAQYDGVVYDDNSMTDAQFWDLVKSNLARQGYTVTGKVEVQPHAAFPTDPAVFTDYFVDLGTNRLKNSSLFKHRILGLVSYYQGARTDVFPDKTEHLVEVDMSEYQMKQYADIRLREREKEKRRGRSRKPRAPATPQAAGKATIAEKGKPGKVLEEVSSYYRVFSRAFCNFVFPETIERPLPTYDKTGLTKEGTEETIEELKMEEPDLQTQFEDKVGTGATSPPDQGPGAVYEAEKLEALLRLSNDGDIYLVPGKEGLGKYSPKFEQMLVRIQASPGPAFVYSQFRSMEGVGIFALVLNSNGFAPLRLSYDEATQEWEVKQEAGEEAKPKYAFYTGTETPEEKDVIKKIYNSDLEALSPTLRAYLLGQNSNGNLRGDLVKVLLATSSAAEGITLANVRQVHITEPYWNPVRMEQVIGRAVRICSHMRLPQPDRHVDVFTYLMKFPEKLLKGKENITLRFQDQGLTSDQAVYEIAMRKRSIMDSVFQAMKEAAVDCTLNSAENEPVKCVSFSSSASPDSYSYHPDLRYDVSDREAAVAQETKTAKVVQIEYPPKSGQSYALNMETQDVYDLDSFRVAQKKGGRPVIVGKMVKKGGKNEIEFK